MAIVNTHYGFCAKGGAAVKFTYTGEYNVRDDGVVELLTSGTIVFLEPKVIDLFMVGGGGAGGAHQTTSSSAGYGGGGGGYTRTLRRISVNKSTSIPVVVGDGGTTGAGKASSFNEYTVNGGFNNNGTAGASGGSGGGGGTTANSDGGVGGSDGGNGEAGGNNSGMAGIGQRFTTREFGESTGKLYAGGGGGGRYLYGDNPVVSLGGAGGGGSGGWASPTGTQNAAAGVANTGGGGGGEAVNSAIIPGIGAAGSGGSGIVCVREAAELPELAGTWVLNNRLYAPASDISQYADFTATYGSSTINCTRAQITDTKVIITSDKARAITIYTFSDNSWTSGSKYGTWTFPEGATASDEFRAWLASNATKQS